MKNSASDSTPEPKDRTKWIWLGVLAVVAVMIVVLWQSEGVTPNRSLVRAKHILISFGHKRPRLATAGLRPSEVTAETTARWIRGLRRLGEEVLERPAQRE